MADTLAWGADKLLAPILTGVFVGLALRWAAISGEVTEHDARAEELNTDLSRWVRDRSRGLDAQIWHALTSRNRASSRMSLQPRCLPNLRPRGLAHRPRAAPC